jgi:hypothetical protein
MSRLSNVRVRSAYTLGIAVVLLLAMAAIFGLIIVRHSSTPVSAPSITLFSQDEVPENVASPERTSVELGVRFQSAVPGLALGVRFLKIGSDTTEHVGSLWDPASRQRLASVRFTDEGQRGWQQALFESAVPVSAGRDYVVSYHTYGNYPSSHGYFTQSRRSGPLTAPAGDNGVFHYGIDSYPDQSSQSSNYWVDVVFQTAVGSDAPTRAPTSSRSPGWFWTDEGGQIVGPDGRRFVPVGINANGPNWVWPGASYGPQAQAAMDRWGFNTLRLNTCLPRGCLDYAHWTTNNDLDAIVAEHTARKHVVIIAQHQYGAGGENGLDASHVAELVSWWKATAARYKGNPYVWFNLINEPTTRGIDDLPAWWNVTTTLADAVRSVASKNVIVMDGNAFGQDKGGWGCDGTDWPAASAILRYGSDLMNKYGAVVFSAHLYGQWGGSEEYGCGPARWDANLNAYLDAVQNLGLPLISGEYGSSVNKADESWQMGGSWNATQADYRVLPARGIGMLFWHGDDGSGTMDLLDPHGSWTDYGSPDHPNLSWLGQGLYDYAQQVKARKRE